MQAGDLRKLRRLGTAIAYARTSDAVVTFAGEIAEIVGHVSRETDAAGQIDGRIKSRDRIGNKPAVSDQLEARLELGFQADPPPAPRRVRIDPVEPPAPRPEAKPVRPPADTLEERRSRRGKAAAWDSLPIGPFVDDPAAVEPELGKVGRSADGKSLIGSQLGGIASE